jgi:hypothetical protein
MIIDTTKMDLDSLPDYDDLSPEPSGDWVFSTIKTQSRPDDFNMFSDEMAEFVKKGLSNGDIHPDTPMDEVVEMFRAGREKARKP